MFGFRDIFWQSCNCDRFKLNNAVSQISDLKGYCECGCKPAKESSDPFDDAFASIPS